MGSTLLSMFASGQDPQQMLQQQQGGMGALSPFAGSGMSPGMRAMPGQDKNASGIMVGQPQMGGGVGMPQMGGGLSQPPGGGMPQRPMMGGGKGDMNPLMMLFPGLARRQQAQQLQNWQMGMAERQQRDAERVTNFNLQQHQAQASEESGEREVIGRTGAYVADHPFTSLQGMFKAVKDANPGVDPKLLGPAFQAFSPMLNNDEKNRLGELRLAEKTQMDATTAEVKRQGVEIAQGKLEQGQQKLEIDRGKAAESIRWHDIVSGQKDRIMNQTDVKLQQSAQSIANAKARGDQAGVIAAAKEAVAVLNQAGSETQKLVALGGSGVDDEIRAKVQKEIDDSIGIRHTLLEKYTKMSEQLGDVVPQGPAPEPTRAEKSEPSGFTSWIENMYGVGSSKPKEKEMTYNPATGNLE